MIMQRDRIDFRNDRIGKLFRELLFPTLIGMVFQASITVADGIFIGRGVGSDALASINIIAPFFMITTGIGLMFGIGSSVIASIHLAKDERKAADIISTQGLLVSFCFTALVIGLLMVFKTDTLYAVGCSDRLIPYAVTYMDIFIPAALFGMLQNVGMFLIRLDGSPKFAMLCNSVPAVINVVLDYLFVFPFGWGLSGAAWASALAMFCGSVMVMYYMFFRTRTIKLYRLKNSWKSIALTLRNTCYIIRIGISALVNESAIASMVIIGNIVFMEHLGEDGVAAFSVACYCLPLVFMLNNAIAQSAQPIISFSYGAGLDERKRTAFRYSIYTALAASLAVTLGMSLLGGELAGLFVGKGNSAWEIASEGLPLFSSGFVFFALNIVIIGYFQSVEKAVAAFVFTILRGIVFIFLYFFTLPDIWGTTGIWLSVPAAELSTFVLILLFGIYNIRK